MEKRTKQANDDGKWGEFWLEPDRCNYRGKGTPSFSLPQCTFSTTPPPESYVLAVYVWVHCWNAWNTHTHRRWKVWESHRATIQKLGHVCKLWNGPPRQRGRYSSNIVFVATKAEIINPSLPRKQWMCGLIGGGSGWLMGSCLRYLFTTFLHHKPPLWHCSCCKIFPFISVLNK